MDAAKFKLALEIPRKDIILSAAHHPESNRFFLGSSDGNVYALDKFDPQASVTALCGHASYVTGLALAPAALVSGSYDGQLIWRDPQTLREIRAHKAHSRWIRNVKASPDGQRIASVADDMVCRVWHADTGELLHELRGHEAMTPTHFSSMLYVCAFSPDGSVLATADRVGRIVVWDAASGKRLAALEAPELYTWDDKQRFRSIGGIRSLAFSPDNQLLAAGGIGKVGNVDGLDGKARVELFDWAKGERVAAIASDKYKGLVQSFVFNDHWLLGAGGDAKGFLIFIDPTEKKIVWEDAAPMHVHQSLVGDDGRQIFCFGHRKIASWQLAPDPA